MLTLPQLERHLFCGGGHLAGEDGCVGVQGVHLRGAVLEAGERCVRAGALSGFIENELARGRSQEEAERRADDRDYYDDAFFVPREASWEYLRDELHHQVGDGLNKALAALEEENPALGGGCCSTSTSTGGWATRRSPTASGAT